MTITITVHAVDNGAYNGKGWARARQQYPEIFISYPNFN